jgi:hypothetical protein
MIVSDDAGGDVVHEFMVVVDDGIATDTEAAGTLIASKREGSCK